MPIIKICQGQPELRVGVVTPGCDGARLADVDNIWLVIHAPAPPGGCLLKSPIFDIGCRLPGAVPEQRWGFRADSFPPHELEAVVCPAFELSLEGELVFRFDHLLWTRPPGRYIGRIEFRSGELIAELDIDLCTQRYAIDRAIVRSPDCF